jgi:diguanylate cyclase (GGDEF)-like protein/PAS domain S-box-containing protein
MWDHVGMARTERRTNGAAEPKVFGMRVEEREYGNKKTMYPEEDFRLLAENTPDIICRCSLDMVLNYVSPSSVDVLGWTPEEMVGHGPDHLVFEGDMQHLREAASATLGERGERTPATVRMRKKDGSLVWIEINPRLVLDPETDQPTDVIVVMRDVSERKLLEEKLSRLAMTDGLTGVANRRAFDEALEREWKLTLRHGTQISLLLLDIDHFKPFNDQYGHQVGDDCLRAVAQAAVRVVRTTDIVARYGGEEIAMILPHVDVAGARETAEKVRSVIEGLRVPHGGNPEGGGWVTVSIGAATALARVGGTMQMPEGLLQAADHALYKAKHGGRNRVEGGILLAPQQLAIVA